MPRPCHEGSDFSVSLQSNDSIGHLTAADGTVLITVCPSDICTLPAMNLA